MAESILVVDRSPAISAAIAAALRAEGFVTREAATGSAAERAIEEFRPDLVVLDLELPDVHGFEVARKLRGQVLIIFLSERDAIADKVAALAVGDDFVTKPFSLSEIVARVRAVLRRANAESSAAC